jgi:Cu+-exporting ATPase
MDTASVVLMKNELADVAVALDVARSMYNRIRLNLLWAFVFNLIGAFVCVCAEQSRN